MSQTTFSGPVKSDNGFIGAFDFPTSSVNVTNLTASGTITGGTGGYKGATGQALITILTATAVLDFPPIPTLTGAELTISVPGAAVGQAVALGVPASELAGLTFMGYVSAAGVVTVRCENASAGSVDPLSGTYRATVFNVV